MAAASSPKASNRRRPVPIVRIANPRRFLGCGLEADVESSASLEAGPRLPPRLRGFGSLSPFSHSSVLPRSPSAPQGATAFGALAPALTALGCPVAFQDLCEGLETRTP